MRKSLKQSSIFIFLLCVFFVQQNIALAAKPLLNSEMIQNKYGNYGVKVLQKTPTLRVSKLYSTHDGEEIARTIAFVVFPKVIDERVRGEHALITEKSQSIGSTFKQRGWNVQKQNRYFGTLATTPKNVRKLMGEIPDLPLALHIYELSVELNGESLHYCTIAELHHPGYLKLADLQKLYGEVSENKILTDKMLKLVSKQLTKI